MHQDLVNSQAHGEFLQIIVYAEEHYIKHRHTQSRWNRKNAYLACNIFIYARARKFIIRSRYKNFNDRFSYVK
jgi:hypothetical protein